MAREGSARASAPESVPEGLIVYRDEALLAADKPAGMIVHGDGTGTRTLTDAVAGALGGDPASTGELQAVNRLDRDTTGLVLFSRAKAVQPALDRLVAERAVEKTYLAAVAGSVPWERRTFEQPIGRDRHDARRMRVSRTGKPARTDARVLARRASGSDGPPQRSCSCACTRAASTRSACTSPMPAFRSWAMRSTAAPAGGTAASCSMPGGSPSRTPSRVSA